MERNILIIGGGLAGLCLGLQLYRRGVSFRIWNSPHIACASQKAAGLMNPVVVKRLLKTWLADEVLPYNRQFYPQAEQLTGARFYSPVDVYRMFSNPLVAGEWKQRMADGTMHGLMSPEIYPYAPDALADNENGGADILQAARVDCGIFIGSVRRFFSEKGLFETRTVSYADTVCGEHGFTVEGEPFSDLVFCEGMQALNNPWFAQLPLLPTKGELLYLDMPGFPVQKEVLKGVFLAPLMRGGFVCGSTYEWRFEHEGPTAEAREKILAELAEITGKAYEITDHTAGIRPASRDRRPLLGEHPRQKRMFVFNGLGTKGYMLAPLLSECLAGLMLHGKPLHREMDIARLKNGI